MNIQNNILRHHLQNVLFICGTACAGKTTMAKLIEEKHGLIRYREGTQWEAYMKYADIKHQPICAISEGILTNSLTVLYRNMQDGLTIQFVKKLKWLLWI